MLASVGVACASTARVPQAHHTPQLLNAPPPRCISLPPPLSYGGACKRARARGSVPDVDRDVVCAAGSAQPSGAGAGGGPDRQALGVRGQDAQAEAYPAAQGAQAGPGSAEDVRGSSTQPRTPPVPSPRAQMLQPLIAASHCFAMWRFFLAPAPKWMSCTRAEAGGKLRR